MAMLSTVNPSVFQQQSEKLALVYTIDGVANAANLGPESHGWTPSHSHVVVPLSKTPNPYCSPGTSISAHCSPWVYVRCDRLSTEN